MPLLWVHISDLLSVRPRMNVHSGQYGRQRPPTIGPMAVKDAKQRVPSAVETAGRKRAILVQLLHAAVRARLGHPGRLAAHAVVLCRSILHVTPSQGPSGAQQQSGLFQLPGMS